MVATAAKLGLSEAALQPTGFGAVDSDGSAALAAQLRQRRLAALDVKRLRSALKWLGDFLTLTHPRPLIRVPSTREDWPALMHNQDSFEQLAEFIRASGSRHKRATGAALTADTISGYVSVLRGYAELMARRGLTAPESDVIMPAAFKSMRRQDGPGGSRALTRAIRPAHVRAAVRSGLDVDSRTGAMRLAVANLSIDCILRGGEPGVADGVAFDPKRDIVVVGAPGQARIEWKEPCVGSAWRPWLLAHVSCIKDQTGRGKPVPIPVSCRCGAGHSGLDSTCAYHAVLNFWRRRVAEVPPAEAGKRPLFAHEDGSAWCTADSAAAAKKIAELGGSGDNGVDPGEVGAKSFRIGGATELRDRFGVEKSKALIKERGRWLTDIHEIYARTPVAEHLAASAALGEGSGVEIEAVSRGWIQPGR